MKRSEFLKEMNKERAESFRILRKIDNRKVVKPKKKKGRKSKDRPRKRYIYALELQGGYYYIGQTVNVENRYRMHLEGRGAKWTKLHKPVSIMESYCVGVKSEGSATDDEDRLTASYAAMFGRDKVRGGRNCAVSGWYSH